MDKDQLLLEELYTQMYDEGWKAKALAGGLGALGLGVIGNKVSQPVSSIPIKRPEISQSASNSPEELLYLKARNHKDFKNLIQNYYNSKGHNVEVSILGDTVRVYSRKQDKSVSFPLDEFRESIAFGKREGDATRANLYLDTWIN